MPAAATSVTVTGMYVKLYNFDSSLITTPLPTSSHDSYEHNTEAALSSDKFVYMKGAPVLIGSALTVGVLT